MSSEDLYQFLIPSPEYLRKGRYVVLIVLLSWLAALNHDSSKSPAPKKFFLAEAIKRQVTSFAVRDHSLLDLRLVFHLLAILSSQLKRNCPMKWKRQD